MNNIKFIKCNLPKIIALLFPVGMFGQTVHLTAGSNMVMNGNVTIVLNNAGIVNDGNFAAGNSTVMFTGNALVASISGTNTSSFNNMAINKSSGDVQLNNDIALNGVVSMLNGNLQLNNHNLTLGSSGSIAGESNQSAIAGVNGGGVFATRKLIPGNALNPGNIGAELLTNDNLGIITVERRHVSETLPDGGQSIDRVFDISASNTSILFTTRLRFFYLDGELEGNDEPSLMLWTRAGIGNFLTLVGKDSSDINGDRVIKNDLDQLGHFTLAGDQGGPATRDMRIADKTAITFGSVLRVYPNPVRDKFTVDLFSKKEKDMVMSLYDQSGHILQQKEIYCQEGVNNILWDITGYAKGIYYLSFKNQELKNIKIVKE